MNQFPETLTTPRLVLRSAKSDDADELFRGYCGDSDCAQYLTRGMHTSPTQTASFLEKWCVRAWTKAGQSFAWVIAEHETNLPIGTFVVIRDGDRAQIHFGIGKQHWGRGLVVEAGQSAVAWLFEHNALRQLSTVCDAEHVQSARVLEKLGFANEGLLKNQLVLPAFGPIARAGVSYVRVRS
jgi:RimJ/RimL family protein N-acetyltransferase